VSALALLATLLLALPAGASAAASRDGYVTSFDGAKIVYSFFPAPGLKAGARAPTVMFGPGYSMSRAGSSDALVAALLADGYNVLTWDPRGFGDSSGNVEIDSPDFEGRDASTLIDLVVKQPEAQLDRPGDPRLGMAGASYGGGIQWVTAANDRRVDVIAPQISWQSLVTSLDKNDTAKGGWGTLLFGLGAEGSTVPGITGSTQPAGPQLGRTQDPHASQAFADGLANGGFSPGDKDFFASRGPGGLVDKIHIPTLIMQGTSDTLFTLPEAIDNYRRVRANGVPVKMLWFCGGLTSKSIAHGICQDSEGPDPSITTHETVRWLDRYLKRDKTVATGPRFEWLTQDGRLHGADDYPPRRGAALTAQGSGTLPLVPGDTSGELIAAAPAANAVNVPIPAPKAPTQLVGEPTLELDYSGTAPLPDARVYAQIVDTATNKVVGPVVTPVKLDLDGAAHKLTMPLEAVSLDAGPGSKYSLQIADGSNVYFAQRQAGAVNLSGIRLAIPTVAPGEAAGNSVPAKGKCVDTRRFSFKIHQHRQRIVRVKVYVDRKLRKTVRGRRVTRVRIKRLPQGLFRVRIVAFAKSGQRTISVRTYRGCVKGKPHTTVKHPHK
jgi:ABC-2 type transport system ATP-binding protein